MVHDQREIMNFHPKPEGRRQAEREESERLRIDGHVIVSSPEFLVRKPRY